MKIIKKRNPIEYIIYTAIIGIGILLDQITKYLAVVFLQSIETQPIIKDAIHLTYVENRGAAFGMMADRREIFIVISTVTIIGIMLYLYFGHVEKRSQAIALSMIISGGIGNMIDRLALGYVVDFIDCRFVKYPMLSGGEWSWRTFPVFNGADSFVCVGAGLLVVLIIMEIVREEKMKKK